MSKLLYGCEDIAPSRKLAYWNGVMREVFFSPWELEPLRPDAFEMTMEAISIEQLRLSKATLTQSKVLNLPRASRKSLEPRYYLQMTTAHQSIKWEDGESLLSPSDITLLHSDMPCLTATSGPYTSISLSVPDEFIREHVPNPRAALGQRFSGTEGLSSTMSRLLWSMWELGEAGALPEVGLKLARNLLEVFATSWFVARGETAEVRPAKQLWSARIKAYADRNLRDPDLTVESIAAALGVSSRYLQMMFAADGDTLSAYIRRRRLEGCSAELIDPMWRDRSITETAFGWGFNNTTHFSRAFREHYGVSAREFRKRRQAGPTRGPAIAH